MSVFIKRTSRLSRFCGMTRGNFTSLSDSLESLPNRLGCKLSNWHGNFLFALATLKNYRVFGLSDGVMVTQRPLEALFMVRIHVGQPKNYSSSSDSQELQASISLTELLCPFAPAERFSQTIRILMSAGDTPEMRAALPMVAGRFLANFCRASRRKLGTVDKSNVAGMDLFSGFLNFLTSNS